MTRDKALMRARIELGPDASVKFRRGEAGPHRCLIGKRVGLAGLAFFDVKASGATWELAFEELELSRRGTNVAMLSEEIEQLLPHANGALRLRLKSALTKLGEKP